MQKPTANGGRRTDASVNREMSCLRHILNKAVEWDLMEINPFSKGRSLSFKENNERLRFLSEEEVTRLLSECPTTCAGLSNVRLTRECGKAKYSL